MGFFMVLNTKKEHEPQATDKCVNSEREYLRCDVEFLILCICRRKELLSVQFTSSASAWELTWLDL